MEVHGVRTLSPVIYRKNSNNNVFFICQDGFKILRNEKVGRYTVASRDLQQGEIIFTETPFAVGPKAGKYIVKDICVILPKSRHWHCEKRKFTFRKHPLQKVSKYNE